MEEINTLRMLHRYMLPIYLLAGCFSFSFAGIYIMVVPLSSLFWPGDPFHALEMGILISTMFWPLSVAGILYGKLIDKYNRIKIFYSVALVRGSCIFMLTFTLMGLGFSSWLYFYIFILIFAFAAGGNYPTLVSLAHDIVPKEMRSRFFGVYNLIRFVFQLIGFVFVGFLVQIGLWRLIFVIMGLALISSGTLMYMRIEEPKRGAQRQELKHLVKEDNVEYDFQMDKQSIRETMLSPTNKIALIEGIFTSIYLGSLTILFLPYIQTPPHNISPLATGIFLAFFGLLGGILGQLYLASISDKFSQEKHIRRIYFIVVSLSLGAFFFVLLFLIPLPHLTVEQGENLILFISNPIMWIMGLIYLSSTSVSALYNINQPPLLQDINLPEAQGQITAWNRFLETIAWGMGPMISGILITISGENYQLVAIIIGLFAVPGIALWIYGLRTYSEDMERINEILRERSLLLERRE